MRAGEADSLGNPIDLSSCLMVPDSVYFYSFSRLRAMNGASRSEVFERASIISSFSFISSSGLPLLGKIKSSSSTSSGRRTSSTGSALDYLTESVAYCVVSIALPMALETDLS